MKVLITGVAGLLGGNLASWILNNVKNTTVVGIDSFLGGIPENIPDKVIFYKRDLAEEDIEDIFDRHNFDVVFHFAAYAAEGLSPFIRKFNYKNNIISTAAIVNECIRHNCKLVYTSSMSVYGKGNPPFKESDGLKPVDPYGISKMACEKDIEVAGKQHGLNYCILRPHNVYGPGQNLWDPYRNVIGIWMYNILHNKPVLIYGSGEQTRSFTFIEDILEPLWKSKDLKNSILNLGATENVSLNNLCKIIEQVTQKEFLVQHVEARFEVQEAFPDGSLSQEILGFKETPLREGLAAMWEWAKQQKDRPVKRWERFELDKGMYSYWKN